MSRPRGAWPRALAVLALLAALAGGGLSVGAAPASATAQPMSKCTTSSGVVLAVDFSHWGGPLLRSCGTTPTTGYALLNQGGWSTTGTHHDGPAFICRIGYAGYQGGKQYPTAKDEACVLTPPATAYWSYWHAGPGQDTWSYGRLGATSYHPEAGSVDLWIFGGTDIGGTKGRPTFPPDTVRARNTAPGGGGSGGGSGGSSGGGSAGKTSAPATHKAPAHPTTAPHPPATGEGEAGGKAGSKSAAPTASTTTSASATPTPSATSTPPGAPAAAPTSAAAPQPQDAEPTAAVHHSSGSVLPVAVALGVVALIGAAVAVRTRKRRNAR